MAGRVAAWVEPLYLAASAPLLLFPTFRPEWTAVALAGFAVLWIARGIIQREPWPVTPYNSALLVFCLAIPLAVWASPVPELTLPKLTGVILGLAAFRVIAVRARSRNGLIVALAALGAAGFAIWLLGVFGLRLAALQPLTQRLPAALVSLPGAEQGINPNQLAGALMLLLPVLIAAATGLFQSGRRVLAALLFLAVLPAVGTLVLTRSRAGWLGFAAAGLAFAFMLVWLGSNLRARKLLAIAALLGLVAALALAPLVLPGLTGSDGAHAVAASAGDVALTLDARLEIWSRALYALQDFPFTGVGLGAFRRVVNVLYPLFLVPPDSDIAHSHNQFLQVGVDLGLIGLVGYVALLIVGFISAWQVAVRERGFQRHLALGVGAALIGFHVYGLADALALGSKPSVLLWVTLGLLAALRHPDAAKSMAPATVRGADGAPAAKQR